MKKEQIQGAIFYIVCFVILIVIMNWNTTGENVYLGSHDISIENYGWNLTINGEDRGKIVLPLELREEKNKSIEIEKEISFVDKDEQYICFRTLQNSVIVYVDDNQIYSYGNTGKYSFSKQPGSAWNFIRLPSNKKSYNIKIVLSSPYHMFSGVVTSVYTGTKVTIYTYLLKKYIPNFFLGILYILIAFFIFFSSLALRKTKVISGLPITIMIFHIGIWFLLESSLDQFIFDKPYLFTQLKVIFVITFPIVLLYYIRSLELYKQDLYLKWCFRFLVACVVGIVGCDFFKMWHIVEAIPLIGGMLLVILLGILRNIFIHYRKKYYIKSISLPDISLVVVIISALHDMIYKYFSAHLPTGTYFFVGVFIFLLVIFKNYEKEYLQLYIMQVEDKRYRELAYRDALTGMESRNAFEEKMEQLRKEDLGDRELYLVIIDINSLKHINDTLGHKVGDKAIIQVANAIHNHLAKYGNCYRIGGDEFCIIIHKIRGTKLKYILDKLAYDIMNEDFVDGFQLSIACGFERYDAEMGVTIDDVLTRADERMYSCKHEMKRM